jgi:hypothetical protein
MEDITVIVKETIAECHKALDTEIYTNVSVCKRGESNAEK